MPFGALCCLSQSVRDLDKLRRTWSEAKVFWWLDVIWESFLNDNTMLSYLVSVILVLYEILDTLSNSTLRWFNWASVTINYQVLVSSISLQLYHICSQLCLILYSFLVRVEAFFAFLLYLISAFISCFSPNSAAVQEQVTKLLSFL